MRDMDVLARLRRRQPLQRFHNRRPRCLMARSVSLRSVAPEVRLFHGLPLRRDAITGSAWRDAEAWWTPRVS